IIAKRVHQYQGGVDAAKEVHRLLNSRLVVGDKTIRLSEAMKLGPDQRRGFTAFLDPSFGGFLFGSGHTPAVTGGNAGDMDPPACFRQADECTTAKRFGIVGV